MEKTQLEQMIANAVHYGHRRHRWNPNMKKYIHGVDQEIHIINLNKTAELLAKAVDFLKKESQEGKTVLFVGTKQHVAELVREHAVKTGQPYVVSRWIPGLLTNFSTMKQRIRHLLELEEKERSGEFEKYTKKEIADLKGEMERLEMAFGGLKTLKKKPDILLVMSAKRDNIAVDEAKRLNIPVIAVCDTDSDPDKVTYPVPGNDDSIKSVSFFLEIFSRCMVKPATK